jgi:hypothetical protein
VTINLLSNLERIFHLEGRVRACVGPWGARRKDRRQVRSLPQHDPPPAEESQESDGLPTR